MIRACAITLVLAAALATVAWAAAQELPPEGSNERYLAYFDSVVFGSERPGLEESGRSRSATRFSPPMPKTSAATDR